MMNFGNSSFIVHHSSFVRFAGRKSAGVDMSRLQEKYQSEVVAGLMEEFHYDNIMEAPKLVKVVVNMGVGRAGQTGGEPKLLDGAVKDLTAITGQKPVITKARKSIAALDRIRWTATARPSPASSPSASSASPRAPYPSPPAACSWPTRSGKHSFEMQNDER
jgi:hypothetical protein